MNTKIRVYCITHSLRGEADGCFAIYHTEAEYLAGVRPELEQNEQLETTLQDSIAPDEVLEAIAPAINAAIDLLNVLTVPGDRTLTEQQTINYLNYAAAILRSRSTQCATPSCATPSPP